MSQLARLASPSIAKRSQKFARGAIVIATLTGVVLPAVAAEEAEGRAWLTGDWGGTRSTWEEAGVVLGGTYTLDVGRVVAGGVRRRSAARGLADLGVLVDLEKAAGLRGALFYAGVQSFRGRNGSEDLGDIQGYSNIDAESSEWFSEIWYEQRLARDRFRLKVGSVDANTEFAFVGAAGEFVNSSAGFSPTIFCLPTYPHPAPSLNVFYHPGKAVRLGLGVYESPIRDVDPNHDTDALFSIGEVDVSWSRGARWSDGRVVLGGWHDSGRLQRFDGSIETGTHGHYAIVEQVVRTGSRARSPRLDLFAQLGQADPEVSEVARHAAVGITSSLPFVRRGADRVGALLTHVDLSDADGASFRANETILELYYGFQVAPWLRVQPDLQYVANPSGDLHTESGFVAGIRIEIAL